MSASSISSATHIQVQVESPLPPMQPDPRQIRLKLIEAGILPSPEEAKSVFWSLGKEWWRQIIDGKYHKHGELVFDQGLHQGHVEPGYLEGVRKASAFFVNCFNEEFSVKLYRETHVVACAHFNIQQNSGVCCNHMQIDEFRSKEGKTTVPPSLVVEAFSQLYRDAELARELSKLYGFAKEPEVKVGRRQELIAQELIAMYDEKPWKDNPDQLSDRLEKIEFRLKRQINVKMQEQEAKLNAYFQSIQERLKLATPFARTLLTDQGSIVVTYETGEIEKALHALIDEFNQNLAQLQSAAYERFQKGELAAQIKQDYQEAVLPLIGRLYAELEWLHPFIDGQGRADLVTLNGLLTREGLHPCILSEPYFSTGNSIEDWIDYLKKGLVAFEEFAKARPVETV